MSSLKNTKKILYGLGNPSPTYDKTLHNIGKLYVNHLARLHKVDFKPSRGKGGEYAMIRNSKGDYITLFKSDGFMNLSGVPYKLLMKNCDPIPVMNQYIIHDDLDSKVGKFKIKNGGSPEQVQDIHLVEIIMLIAFFFKRGHNGLRSIIDSLGNKDFQRIKIGIGRPDSKDPEIIANYVTTNILSEELKKYKDEIFPQIDEFLKKSNVL